MWGVCQAGNGFKKDANKNRLREHNIEKIVRVFKAKKEIPGFSRFVNYSEIFESNDGNLNVPRFIQKIDEDIPQSISAHITGGIPEDEINTAKKLWEISPNLRAKIFTERENLFYVEKNPEDIAEIIANDGGVNSQIKLECEEKFSLWQKEAEKLFDEAIPPKKIIRHIGERLIEIYDDALIADKYDIFDCLMNYWNEKLQDDIYLIRGYGLAAGREAAVQYAKVKGKSKVISFDGEIIPREIIERKFFCELGEKITTLQNEIDRRTSELEDWREEHPDGTTPPEFNTNELQKKQRKFQSELDEKVLEKYSQLTESEIRDMLLSIAAQILSIIYGYKPLLDIIL